MDRYVYWEKLQIKSVKNGFGALPIQRISKEAAAKLLTEAFDAGYTYFDTARMYSDSEEKIGYALHDKRDQITLATKTGATTTEAFWKDLETSLKNLQTDHIDIYQFHNPAFCPKPGDGTGLYEAMLEAKQSGKIKHIGITNHRLAVAKEAVESGLYESLQFPFSYLSSQADIDLVNLCKEKGVAFIAMKALSGGLITNARAAYAFMLQFDNVLPIWGVQREKELQDFIGCMTDEPVLDEATRALIEHDKQELAGEFCRGCGYCMPCPAGIDIHNCARMSQLIRRSPSAGFLSAEGQKKMFQIEQCLNCGQCKAKCPYGLDTPNLLKRNLEDYKRILAGKADIT